MATAALTAKENKMYNRIKIAYSKKSPKQLLQLFADSLQKILNEDKKAMSWLPDFKEEAQ